MESKRKNDYSVIVYLENESKPKKWTYVHKLNGFSLFLNKQHPAWEYMNVYNRRSRKFMKRFRPNDFIPAFLQVWVFFFFLTFKNTFINNL